MWLVHGHVMAIADRGIDKASNALHKGAVLADLVFVDLALNFNRAKMRHSSTPYTSSHLDATSYTGM